MDLANNTLERLIQEHAIYKSFFDNYLNRPRNNPQANHNYIKAKAFDVVDSLNQLNNNVPYYDANWKDADKNLFVMKDPSSTIMTFEAKGLVPDMFVFIEKQRQIINSIEKKLTESVLQS